MAKVGTASDITAVIHYIGHRHGTLKNSAGAVLDDNGPRTGGGHMHK